MDRLIKTLPLILQAAGDSTEVMEAACIAAWKSAAGEGLRDHACPLRFSENTLVVAVADATWQQQLRSLSSQLLFRLNSLLGRPLVTLLEFRVDPESLAKAIKSHDAKPTSRERVDPQAVPLELAAAATRIHDKELRRAFLGAAISCLRRVENP